MRSGSEFHQFAQIAQDFGDEFIPAHFPVANTENSPVLLDQFSVFL